MQMFIKSASKGGLTGAILLILSFLFCTGCQTPTTSVLADQPAPTPGILATGDVIKLTYPGNADYTQTQQIRSDGKISLPMIGEVDAAGKTIAELRQEVTQRNKEKGEIKIPDVIITLDSSAIPVYISGAVGKPGKIVLDRPMSVLEGIMEAGGFLPIANQKHVVLVRIEDGQHHSYVLDLSAALKGQTAKVVYLKPYDVIYVKENLF
jgi:polysaccharide biosynthesis/export protein